jgi:hypothetical protein
MTIKIDNTVGVFFNLMKSSRAPSAKRLIALGSTATLNNAVDASIDCGYADTQRVLIGIGIGNYGGKTAGCPILHSKLVDYFNAQPKNKAEFDKWHECCCKKLLDTYAGYLRTGRNIGFTIGTAQKWVNMTFKYIYTHYRVNNNDFGITDFEKYFTYCHMALDRYTLQWCAENKKLPPNITPWSLINDYGLYRCLQNQARDKVRHDLKGIVGALQARVIANSLPFPNTAAGLTTAGITETLFRCEFLIWEIYRNL